MSPDLLKFAPELLVTLGGLVLIIFPWLKSSRLLGWVTLMILLGALDLKVMGLVHQPVYSLALFSGLFVLNRFSVFLGLLILVSMVLVVLSLMGHQDETLKRRRELYALLLLSAGGLLVVIGAQHLALIYLGLELVSIFSYLMVGLNKKDSLALEGALKYYLFGVLATGAMLYGITLVYGLTGTMMLADLVTRFPAAFETVPVLCLISLFLLVVGLGFKLALVPFHMWAPDAYEGAPTPIAAYLSVGPKLAGFAVLAQIFLVAFAGSAVVWGPLLAWLAVITMTLGNVTALVQTNVKRLLAYSSIAHAGTMTIGLAVGTPLGLTATLFYLLAYLLMNIGAFVGVIAVGNLSGREDLDGFKGLSRTQPMLAFLTAVCLLSLTGIPPLAGFFAKLWIFGAAIEAGWAWLAIAAGINSVIAAFYYMKVIKTIYLDPAPAAAEQPEPHQGGVNLTLILCVAGLLLIGLWPDPWMNLASRALPTSLAMGNLPW